MNKYKILNPLVPIGIYFLLVFLLYPHLQFNLDADCVGYLTIAERVARGDYFRSINGLWSPLNCWLIVPFIKMGYEPWLAAKMTNIAIGFALLLIVYFLFQRFLRNQFSNLIGMLVAACVIAFFVYFQMFGDVLQLFFVILYLLIVIPKNKTLTTFRAILAGVIMALAFYAKSYSIVFFIMHFAFILFWHFKNDKFNIKKGFSLYIIGLISCIIVILPWSIALHTKYQNWNVIGNAGKLNMSWQINSGKTFKNEIRLLIPPTYEDSPSFWEDPFPSQGQLISPLSSASHFAKWCARVVHTILVSITCFNEISSLSLAILILSFFYFFKRKKEISSDDSEFDTQLLVLTIAILPLGYLLMHIETRYIWLILFLSFIVGVLLIEKMVANHYAKLAIVILGFTFLVSPILQLKNLNNKNKELFEIADFVKQNNLKGSFTSNTVNGDNMWVVAYLTKNPFYTIERTDYTQQELLDEMKRYHVKYFFEVSENNKLNFQLDSNIAKKIAHQDGLDIFEMFY